MSQSIGLRILSGHFGGLDPTLKSYTDGKVVDFKDGGGSYLKLRDATVNASGNRTGTQKIEFLRTTPSESYGDDECADWRLTTNNTCGLDIHRKQTDPTLGSVYDGNVIEFKQDGDVNVVKPHGIRVNNTRVALYD